MSGRLVGEILDHAPTDLRALDFAVLIALAESARWGTRTATHQTTAAAIAERVRPISTPGSVRNALSRLTRRGLIRPLLDGIGPGKAQHYMLARLTTGHRFATHNASPPGDTYPTTNGTGTRHPPVTRLPVDTPNRSTERVTRTPRNASPDAVTPSRNYHP